jgi:hypothetical protein
MSAEGSTRQGTASPSFTTAEVTGTDDSWFGRLASAYLAKRLARAHVAQIKDAAIEVGRVLGRTYDDARIERMVKDFSDAGVLRGGRANHARSA